MARVLVVEPNNTLRPLLAHVLETGGHSVQVAKNLKSARLRLHRGAIDIVVSEMRLGVATRDGLAVLEAANSAVPRPRVVFLTAYGQVSSAVEAIKLGAYECIDKPIDPESLLALVKNAAENLGRKDVFLCHASGDKRSLIVPFVKSLRRHGVTFWVDEAEIHWGDSITDKISEGLLSAYFVTVFLTDAFLERHWPALEMKTALSREASVGETIVLPVFATSPRKILARYPLLSDKSYAKWSDGPDALAARLKKLIADRVNRDTRRSK